MKIPQQGIEKSDLRARMEKYRMGDGDAAGARLFSLVYATRSASSTSPKGTYERFSRSVRSVR